MHNLTRCNHMVSLNLMAFSLVLVFVSAHAQEIGAAAPRARVAAFFDRSRTRELSEETVLLARDGSARFDIVVPVDAPPALGFAAEELQRYLQRLSGAAFPIRSQPGSSRSIFLGADAAAREAGIDVSQLARDGYAIQAGPERVIIAGKDDSGEKGNILFEVQGTSANDYELVRDSVWDFNRGTLNGVYAFLEECGCRWFFPGDLGEVVPSSPTLTVRAFRTVREPEFALRVFGRTVWRVPAERHAPIRDTITDEIDDMGVNTVATRMWLVRNRASSEWFAFNHRPPRTSWEKRFGETHPEYFAVLPSGDRDLGGTNVGHGHTGHLCYSEEGVYTETIKDIDAFFSGRRAEERGISERYAERFPLNRGWAANACYGDTVSLLPHDGFRGCHCPACLARTDLDGPARTRHSRLVWPFVAQVGRYLEKAHPDRMIICLAYASYSEVPDEVDLPDNVIVGVCPRRLNKIHNIIDEGSYAELFSLIEDLSEANEMPLLYWFHHLYRLGARQATNYGVPLFLPHFYKRFITDLAPYGRLFFAEMDQDSIMFEHLNRYIVLRLLYAPESDVDVLLEDYLTRLYGPGAPHLRPLIVDIEKKSMQIAAAGMGRRAIWRDVYTAEVLSAYQKAVDQALNAVEDTPRAPAVRLFNDHVLGLMHRGRARHIRQFENAAVQKQAVLPVKHVADAVVIDGRLDEPGWQQAATRRLANNVDGQPLQWLSTVRVLHRDGMIYCGFVCEDPRVAEEGHAQVFAEDYVEVFLQPDPTSPVFYQVLAYPSGTILDFRCDQRGQKWDRTWHSHAQSAAIPTDRGWTIEIAVPISSMLPDGAGRSLESRRWRGHFCRTTMHAPEQRERFGSSSPFMRGSFRQPDLFGTVAFE